MMTGIGVLGINMLGLKCVLGGQETRVLGRPKDPVPGSYEPEEREEA